MAVRLFENGRPTSDAARAAGELDRTIGSLIDELLDAGYDAHDVELWALQSVQAAAAGARLARQVAAYKAARAAKEPK